MITFLYIIFFIVCLVLVAVVLLQSSRAAGMGIFGSSSSQTPFGSRSGDVLAKFTSIVAIIFIVGAFGLAVLKSKRMSPILKELEKKRRSTSSTPALPAEPIAAESAEGTKSTNK